MVLSCKVAVMAALLCCSIIGRNAARPVPTPMDDNDLPPLRARPLRMRERSSRDDSRRPNPTRQTRAETARLVRDFSRLDMDYHERDVSLAPSTQLIPFDQRMTFNNAEEGNYHNDTVHGQSAGHFQIDSQGQWPSQGYNETTYEPQPPYMANAEYAPFGQPLTLYNYNPVLEFNEPMNLQHYSPSVSHPADHLHEYHHDADIPGLDQPYTAPPERRSRGGAKSSSASTPATQRAAAQRSVVYNHNPGTRYNEPHFAREGEDAGEGHYLPEFPHPTDHRHRYYHDADVPGLGQPYTPVAGTSRRGAARSSSASTAAARRAAAQRSVVMTRAESARREHIELDPQYDPPEQVQAPNTGFWYGLDSFEREKVVYNIYKRSGFAYPAIIERVKHNLGAKTKDALLLGEIDAIDRVVARFFPDMLRAVKIPAWAQDMRCMEGQGVVNIIAAMTGKARDDARAMINRDEFTEGIARSFLADRRKESHRAIFEELGMAYLGSY
jgi:hypothetical protein